MGDDDQRGHLGGERAPNLPEGTLTQRHAEYLAALTPPAIQAGYPSREPRYIDGSRVAWMVFGHVTWIVALALLGGGTGAAVWFAAAGAHLVALVLVVVAWASRASSVEAARAVAWVSTPLLGIAAALLATALVGGVEGLLAEDDNEFEGSMLPVFAFVTLVFVAVVAVPTIGAFLAAVSHARSLRGGV